MVLISESHVFVSWMHVFWNADTGFGTNSNIDAKNGCILNPTSSHISRKLCQLLENIPLMFTRCLFLLYANLSLWGYTEWFEITPIMPQRLRRSYHVNPGRGELIFPPWAVLFSEDRKMFGWISQGNAIQLEFVCSFPDELNYKLHGRWNLS